MRVYVAVVAVLIMLLVLRDAFEATVFPRRTTRRYRPARVFFYLLWLAWARAAQCIQSGSRRQHFRSIFGPLSLLALFALWVVGLIGSFALLHWSLGAQLRDVADAPSLAACAYLSGETFFTLGYGDLAPSSWTGRFLSVVESGMGFGFLAIVIGYLPLLNQAFSRREQIIGLLDARAGSPPTAGELLRRSVQLDATTQIGPLLWEWERWSADLLEGQLSFPILAYYRSQHDNQSWLAGLAVILDTCAVMLAHLPDIDRYQVQMTFAMARHAAVDMALIFRLPPQTQESSQRQPAAATEEFLQLLAASELKVDCSKVATEKLGELRLMYEPFLCALGSYFQFDLPPIISAQVDADNWQRSAWLKRAPGIGNLSASRVDEHFA